MKVLPTDFPGVVVIEPDVHQDARGFFLETYHARKYAEAGITAPFVQDNHSRSACGTVRGLHAQRLHPQGKLVRVLSGEIFDVVVDIRRGSPTFGRWMHVILSADNFRQCYVPPDFAHGFCVLSDIAELHYKCTDIYVPGDEGGVAWNDPDLAIAWPLANPSVGERDAAYPRLKDIPPDRLPKIA